MSINVDNYVTTLGPEMLKRAEDEFGETEQLRETTLFAIREWIKKQPHLVSLRSTGKKIKRICKNSLFLYNNSDAMFLMKFVRICKFSLVEAKKKLESMSTVRSKINTLALL